MNKTFTPTCITEHVHIVCYTAHKQSKFHLAWLKPTHVYSVTPHPSKLCVPQWNSPSLCCSADHTQLQTYNFHQVHPLHLEACRDTHVVVNDTCTNRLYSTHTCTDLVHRYRLQKMQQGTCTHIKTWSLGKQSACYYLVGTVELQLSQLHVCHPCLSVPDW